MLEPKILFSVEEQVATIMLNRPEKLNALDPEMLNLLDKVIQEIDQRDDIRVVVLTGAGERAFCAGADIHTWSALHPLDMWRRWIRDGHRLYAALARLRQPVIAALNGYTFGGGLELALAADMRIAADGIELSLPEAKLGTIPGWGGTQRLPALIGAARTKQMIFTGGRITAEVAESWGLVNEVVPREQLITRTNELAAVIVANAPLSVQFAKQLIDSAYDERAGAIIEALAGALAATTEDGKKALLPSVNAAHPNFAAGKQM